MRLHYLVVAGVVGAAVILVSGGLFFSSGFVLGFSSKRAYEWMSTPFFMGFVGLGFGGLWSIHHSVKYVGKNNRLAWLFLAAGGLMVLLSYVGIEALFRR